MSSEGLSQVYDPPLSDTPPVVGVAPQAVAAFTGEAGFDPPPTRPSTEAGATGSEGLPSGAVKVGAEKKERVFYPTLTREEVAVLAEYHNGALRSFCLVGSVEDCVEKNAKPVAASTIAHHAERLALYAGELAAIEAGE